MNSLLTLRTDCLSLMVFWTESWEICMVLRSYSQGFWSPMSFNCMVSFLTVNFYFLLLFDESLWCFSRLEPTSKITSNLNGCTQVYPHSRLVKITNVLLYMSDSSRLLCLAYNFCLSCIRFLGVGGSINSKRLLAYMKHVWSSIFTKFGSVVM